MSKTKKIVISFIIGILAILGINSVSNAYYIGQKLYVSYGQYTGSSNILCMQEYQSPPNGSMYKVIEYVDIKGTKATDSKGKEIDHIDNAKFAYILSSTGNKWNVVRPVVWKFGPTWMKNVGSKFDRLNNYPSSGPGWDSTGLYNAAVNYANSLKSGNNVKDNTVKKNVKIENYTKDNKQYMRVGPFNWSFGGTLTEVSVYDQNSKSISGLLYSSFSGNTEKWYNAGDIKSGKDFYISIPVDSGVTKITKITGKMKMNVKSVRIWFLDNPNQFQQNLIIREPKNDTQDIEFKIDTEIPLQGHLKVIKVNKDNTTVKIKGVGFYIQNKNTGKYIRKADNGAISYVEKKDATEFITDDNGEILIKNLVVGTYVTYETKNPNVIYEVISEGKEKDVVVDKTAELQIPNTQKYIKLSGYVWVDRRSGKQSERNNLYKEDSTTYDDSKDILLDGITVRLKDNTSDKVIKETKTAKGGAYQFTDVLVDDLDKYYIEFEYDGLTYTNVVPKVDKGNGSKAAESATTRDTFNRGFSSIVGGDTKDTGRALDENGNVKNKLAYNYNYDANKGATSTLINNGQYVITANTNETKYTTKNTGLKDHFTPGQEEIKNINLGLYEREQPDISLVKDIDNVKVSINGYNHVYKYNQRFKEVFEPINDDLNVGVQYKNAFTGSYNRAIYESDYKYSSADGKNELEVYVTYALRINNESSSLTTRVNSIVDYYDSNYEVCGVGTSLSKDTMDVQNNINYNVSDYNKDYSKLIINNNTKVDAGKYTDVYVQFKLNKQAVINIINDKENLDNVAEINSYSVFNENGNVYAGIDKDSNPGNAVPGDKTTYGDDTNSSPGLLLEVVADREMTGKVFLDDTSKELMTGEIRQGDGKYTDKDKGISGVKVTLTENTGTGKVYETTTNENGDFNIKGYIPGEYTLTYTWGDKTYTVHNYKGTIYKEKDRANDKNWYKVTEPRYSDALDDYNLRLDIDEETAIVPNGEITIDKMNSTTPTMGIGIEEETDGNTKYGITSIESEADGDKFTPKGFAIKNVDFGIVERARQSMELNKRVKAFKVTLANGQVIADVTIDKDGKLTGTKDHITYMGPSATNGFVKLELDNELIQGATTQIEYEVTVNNNSEKDYDSEEYYKYGDIKGNIITITPTGVYDYLDSTMTLDTTKDNVKWEVVSKEVYDNKYQGDTIVESYFTDSKTIDEDGNTIYKWEIGGTSYQSFFEEWATEVTETRTIRDVKLDNKTILHNADLENAIEPGKENSATIYVSKVLANTDEIDLNNDAEITETKRTTKTGSMPTLTGSTFIDRGETVTITPPTGHNKDYIAIILTTISGLIILATGVVLIRKKILGDK